MSGAGDEVASLHRLVPPSLLYSCFSRFACSREDPRANQITNHFVDRHDGDRLVRDREKWRPCERSGEERREESRRRDRRTGTDGITNEEVG